MKMTLRLEKPYAWSESRIVNFDSEHPENSEQYLGHWWRHQIYTCSYLHIVGTRTSDGIHTYTVLSIESPFFDVNRSYCQRFLTIDVKSGPAIRIIGRFEQDHLWMYDFAWGTSPQIYTLTEGELLRFLTEPTNLLSLPKQCIEQDW